MTMRVAMVTPFPQERDVVRGGVEGVANALVAALKKNPELEIHVVAPSNAGDDSQEERDGVRIHWLGRSSLPGFLDYWTLQRRRVHRLLGELRPSVTHFQGIAGWTVGYRQPAVLTLHGIIERDALFTKAPMRVLRSRIIAAVERVGRRTPVDKIIINPYVRDSIGGQLGGRLWDIENPVTEDFFRLERSPGSRRILYVGRISARKNIIGLLRVFKRVRADVSGATLHLAGSPDTQEFLCSCRAFIAEHGLGDSVELIGNIDRARLLTELAQANSLALLSHQETAPMVVEEAMAAGVPVVASRICGLPYMVEDGVTGYLAEPGDEIRAAACLRGLLLDVSANVEMGRCGRQVAMQRFHVDAIAKLTTDVYRAAIRAGEPTNSVALSHGRTVVGARHQLSLHGHRLERPGR